jgi:hypothetical protein
MATPTNLKLFQAELDNIIRTTESAITNMTSVNSAVNYLGPNVQRNNQSDSGKVILKRLNDWTDDYPKIVGDLTQINRQVHAMRNALSAGADFATSAAAGSA